jgi:predicted secreted protein
MKRNSVLKSIVLSATVSAILAGCGSSATTRGDEDPKKGNENKEVVEKVKATSITGKAIDGYLQFATVCLDLNKDGYCQPTEPMSSTKKDGSFALDISAEVQALDSYKEAMLLVYGGRDVDTGVDFSGKLLAPADSVAVHITPITTLVAKAVQKELKANPDLTKEQIKEKVTEKKAEVAKVFGIEVEDIALDPIEVQATKPELIKHSLKIQKAAEAMAGGTGDDEKIEEVYEKLAEKLSQAEQSKGIDDLLTKTFADDATKAKEVSANIEKAYTMYKGNLRKVAYITKQDMKKVRGGQTVTAPVEIIEGDWDKTYVRADLEDIGIDNPTDDQVDAIIEKIGAGVVPGAVFEKAKEWESEANEDLKKVFIDAKKLEEVKKKKEDLKKAKKDGKIKKFTAGTKFYEVDFLKGAYDEITVGKNNVSFKLFYLDSGAWNEYVDSHNNVKYVLKNGVWEEKVDSKSYASTINDDGTLTIEEDNLQVTLLNQKDVSNQKVYIPEIDMYIAMPSGAKTSYLEFKALHDEYRLDHKYYPLVMMSSNDDSDRPAITLDTYISDNCKSGYFKTEDNKVCDATTQKGISYGYKWEIKTVDGIKILEEHYKYGSTERTTIYSMVGEDLYEGRYIKAGIQKNPDLEYNEVAMNAIKKVMEENFVDGVSEGSSSSDSSGYTGDSNSTSSGSDTNNSVNTPTTGETDEDTQSNYEQEMSFLVSDLKTIGYPNQVSKDEFDEIKSILGKIEAGTILKSENVEKLKDSSFKIGGAIYDTVMLRNKFKGQFLYFKEDSYITGIAFYGDKASLRTSDNQEWEGSWSVNYDTITINDNSGAKIYITFEKSFKEGPYNDLESGDNATYEIDPGNSSHNSGSGNLEVNGVGL